MSKKAYRARVMQGDDGWLVAEARTPRGLVTQGRDLDELAFMVRDAIEQLTDSTDFAIQLVLPAALKLRKTAKKRSKKAA